MSPALLHPALLRAARSKTAHVIYVKPYMKKGISHLRNPHSLLRIKCLFIRVIYI